MTKAKKDPVVSVIKTASDGDPVVERILVSMRLIMNLRKQVARLEEEIQEELSDMQDSIADFINDR